MMTGNSGNDLGLSPSRTALITVTGSIISGNAPVTFRVNQKNNVNKVLPRYRCYRPLYREKFANYPLGRKESKRCQTVPSNGEPNKMKARLNRIAHGEASYEAG